ncbi:MAG: (Fe-S)-binding protein [Wenzhouxiangellaceae bacterium]|nr:(Fe-S)-binding protein [Wenzhouxiangellaceae bacterium]
MSTATESFSRDAAPEDRLAPSEREERAMREFAWHFGAFTATNLEACIHCGMCAEACHFYIATEDPKYTPILKAEPFKQAYRRESGAFAPFFKLLGLKKKVTVDELEEWQELLFDSCTQCGRCSLICPMGIEVAEMIEVGRRGMAAAGLAPRELMDRARRQAETGAPEKPARPYAEVLAEIGREFDIEIPLDRDKAGIMVCAPRTDLERNPAAVAAMAKILNRLGADYTFRSEALIAENYGYYAGSRALQKKITRRVVDQAVEIGAAMVIVPECGHAYTALRWQAAEIIGEKLPFRVRHITEYLAEQLAAGKLRLDSVDGESFAFHDPCQLVRKGGITDAPRELMKAMGVDLREMENKKGFSFCCGGGGGVNDLERARPLRYRAQEIKLREVDETGATRFMTSCSDCRVAFDDAAEHFNWDKKPESLVELVAANIKD